MVLATRCWARSLSDDVERLRPALMFIADFNMTEYTILRQITEVQRWTWAGYHLQVCITRHSARACPQRTEN